jgi:hypothetical protein
VLAVEDGTGVLAGSGVTAEGVEALLAGGATGTAAPAPGA